MSACVSSLAFTIFGPTSIASIAPYWNDGQVISNLPSCAPCYPDKLLGCEKPICMQNITVDMVYNCIKDDGVVKCVE